MHAPAPLFVAIGFTLSAAFASGASVSLDKLVTNSPFMPPQTETVAAPVVTEGAVVEFRGLITTKDGVLFGLYDRSRNIGAWVTKDEAGADFRVSNYDEGAELVTVEYEGQRFTLPLSSAKVGEAPPTPLPAANRSAQGGNRVNAVPGGRTDDQRRLESVAAEVRRRRALRQAAAGGGAAAQPANNAR